MVLAKATLDSLVLGNRKLMPDASPTIRLQGWSDDTPTRYILLASHTVKQMLPVAILTERKHDARGPE